MHFTDDEIEATADIRFLVEAAASIGRLDISMQLTPALEAFYAAPARRREAISIASLEGALVRTEALCRLLGNPESTNLERSIRLAADIHAGLTEVATWGLEPPSSETLRSLFDIADASVGRRMKQDVIWTLEEDCIWLHNELVSFMERPSSWDAIETLRGLWTSGRFLGTAKRIAMLISGWLLARGFGCDHPVIGLAGEIARDTDGFRDAAQAKVTWIARVGQALKTLGDDGRRSIDDGKASKASMLALCPPEKNSSSVERAVEFMMVSPVFSAKAFSKALGLTPRGAKVVLDKLEEADVVEVDGGLRNRNFVCRRAM